jgi:hypothetical protein
MIKQGKLFIFTLTEIAYLSETKWQKQKRKRNTITIRKRKRRQRK